MNYLKLGVKAIGYNLIRILNTPKILPLNYTFLITKECNSKCKTCLIWKNKNDKNELTTNEWNNVCKSIGKKASWITITSGEPFLRKDIKKIINSVLKYNQPDHTITFAKNGKSTLKNSALSHEKCNIKKSNKPLYVIRKELGFWDNINYKSMN
ncbi:hypothetical protein CMO90_03220 [Candidatus Woesearchaeota archaeon]|jgi:MoaA/NifB/PqqE/SkfB family radical SAM enzyme|nr:hypothetical protein [Candidatus Woesearchaeota archaeon]|tara:strand:+ start:382 stop:843 length:462 start_codon:yes stop_codon:yes gene_type:complete